MADKIYVSKSVVRDLKLYYRANPGSFLRRLLERGGLFTLEEIASSSVLGKPSSHGATRNPLDPIKLKAAKGEYCVIGSLLEYIVNIILDS